MNKLICDVCGTMYPENAGQCPICGSASTDAAVSNASSAEGTEAVGTYSHAKGGHFSKSNVRKRNKTAAKTTMAATAAKEADEDTPEPEKNEGSNKGLIIAIVLLMIAIVGMLCYIFFVYFAPDIFGGETEPGTSAATTTEASTTSGTIIACTGLDLQVPNNEITLEKADHAWLLNVVTTPADTTDEITYKTSDPNVAAVSSDGRITAVGRGTAIITVTCGDVVKECKVVCNLPAEDPTEETTEATTEATTEPTTEPTTKPEVDLSKFYLYPRRDGDCMVYVGESFTLLLRDGNHKKVDVTWTATEEGYFTIDGNVITGVKVTPEDGNKADKIRATCTYEGVEFSCIIRVREKPTAETIEPPEPTEYTGPTIDDPGYEISHTDVTIKGGETFTLTLKDSNGQPVEATWESSNPGIAAIDGNKITGKVKGKTIVSVRVANWVYECIVRVSSTVKDDAVG